MKRVLTAAALIPIICYVVLWSDPRVFIAVLAAAAFLSWREYNAIAIGDPVVSWPSLLGYAAGAVLLVTSADPWLVILLLALAALALSMRSEPLAGALPRAAAFLLGIVYIFGTWRCAVPLRAANPHWLMYALLVSWTGDIGAYYVGRAFGRHRLAPRVSPNKSWEGAVASVGAALLLSGAYLVYFVGAPVSHAAVLTAAANAAGQVGDLCESAIKRGAGVKDSGAILPGHGGFLDRVDSTLFTLPVVYLYLRYFNFSS
jgi:phosphatidate cytidylyltransferase